MYNKTNSRKRKKQRQTQEEFHVPPIPAPLLGSNESLQIFFKSASELLIIQYLYLTKVHAKIKPL